MDRRHEIDVALNQLVPPQVTWSDVHADEAWLKAFPMGIQPMFEFADRLVLDSNRLVEVGADLDDDEFLLFVENAIESVFVMAASLILEEHVDDVLDIFRLRCPEQAQRLERVARANGFTLKEFVGIARRATALPSV